MSDILDIRTLAADWRELVPEYDPTTMTLGDGREIELTTRDDDDGDPIEDRATCGVCGFTWNDAGVSEITPAPSGRCPNEYSHADAEKYVELCGELGCADAEKYVELCGELGCDADPDSLERWGDDYDPTLIPENGFEDYARGLADDLGAVDANAGWPMTYIDWPRAAAALARDYTMVRFDGSDYYVRSY